MRLAIVSPSERAYSESFIQAHRKITGNALFYYGGFVPQFLDGHGLLLKAFCNSRMLNICIHFLKNPRMLTYPRSLNYDQKILANSFKENKVTHVLAEFGNCAVEVMAVCEYLNIKLISHFHGYEISKYEIIESYKGRYNALFQTSFRVIAVSRLMLKRLSELGCPEEKLVYCPCGPDDSFGTLNPDFANKNILYVGRFVDKKAPYDLILAFKSVAATIPDSTLTMIGVGELYDCCIHLASYLGLSDKIHFEGIVDHSRVGGYFENAAVYCQPSVTAESGDQEGTPVSVMEASLAALPVVATKHAGITDVIIDGETGFLVDEHDVDGLANKLIEVLSNREEAIRMGKCGRIYINENFVLSKSLCVLRQALQ